MTTKKHAGRSRKRTDAMPAGLRGITLMLFIIYLVLLFRLVVLKQPVRLAFLKLQNWSLSDVKNHWETANRIPGHTIRLYLRHWESLGYIAFANLVFNVAVFIPYGVAVPILRDRRYSFFPTVLSGILLTVLIEGVQLFTIWGHFDVDDMILNSLGVLLGWMIFAIWFRITLGNPHACCRRHHST